MPSSLITILRPHPDTTSTIPAVVDEAAQRGLLQALATVPDPRDPRGIRYQLTSLLAVAVCAVMAGAVTFAAIADRAADLDQSARHRLGFTGPIPAGTTVWRFLIRLDACLLQAVPSSRLQTRIPPPPAETPQRPNRTVIAVDGKVVRGARLPEDRQVHLLSAYDTTTGIVLAQSTIAAKSNEIPAFIPLLDQVQAILGSSAGAVIVADALHAQVGHVHHLVAQGAHLLIPIKANQPTAFRQLRSLPWAQVSVGHRTRDRAHGRRETRTPKAVTVQTPGGLGFPHAAQAARITRTRTIAGKTTRETAYLIVTLPATDAQPVDLHTWARPEWHIENR